MTPSPHRVVIIGSGPAGWTAAIYAARAQLEPVVYIGVPKQTPSIVLPGGQLMLTTEVENFPGFHHGIKGPDLMAECQKQAERFGTKVIPQDIVACDFSRWPFVLKTSKGEQVLAQSVILATGAIANWLGLPNEMRLAMIGGGVSACAVCDGALPIFRNKPVAVVGGGDSAMEEATYLTKFASEVTIIHRRDSFRASKIMQQRFMARPNARVLWNTKVIDVLGDEKVSGLALENTVTGGKSTMQVAGLFAAIGHTPATGFLKGAGVDVDEKGYVVLRTRSSATNIEGVFAAGDVADARYRQAITAAGMGCQAALDAEHWLAAHAEVDRESALATAESPLGTK